jgi:dTDP-4-dehydrorhamnose 3,5-epimerase-like enzyme
MKPMSWNQPRRQLCEGEANMAMRDKSGPDHAPNVVPLKNIHGVILQHSPVVKYSEGFLTEHYRPEWYGVFAESEPIEHLYSVYSPNGGTRVEWYFHEYTLDRYSILLGDLEMGLYDGRSDSPTFDNFVVVTLSALTEGVPNAIRIPPGVWHSLRWASASGMFLNAKLPPYNRGIVDKFRVAVEDLPSAITWNVE